MKIKSRKKVIALCAAFVAAGVGMNVQNAIASYGMASPKGSRLAQSITGRTDYSNYSFLSSVGSSIASNASTSSSSSNGDRDWFAALRPAECKINKINIGGAFYYKGVLIPAGGTYYVYGTRMECQFNLFNTCDVTKQTACKES